MHLRGEMTEIVDPGKRLSLDTSTDVGSDEILVC
jgi:chemotaxis signal transduction protein